METPFFFCGCPKEIAVTSIFDIFAEATVVFYVFFRLPCGNKFTRGRSGPQRTSSVNRPFTDFQFFADANRRVHVFFKISCSLQPKTSSEYKYGITGRHYSEMYSAEYNPPSKIDFLVLNIFQKYNGFYLSCFLSSNAPVSFRKLISRGRNAYRTLFYLGHRRRYTLY